MENQFKRWPKPTVFTFDIFGTVIDWSLGLGEAVRRFGRRLDVRDFERVTDFQGEREQAQPFRSYREIASESFVEILGLDPVAAEEIALGLGRWPLFPDSTEGLRSLMQIAPCVAMTNSDTVHGEQVQQQLGFHLSRWICAEEARCYKPSAEFWRVASKQLGVALNNAWWHVSAYADYD